MLSAALATKLLVASIPCARPRGTCIPRAAATFDGELMPRADLIGPGILSLTKPMILSLSQPPISCIPCHKPFTTSVPMLIRLLGFSTLPMVLIISHTAPARLPTMLAIPLMTALSSCTPASIIARINTGLVRTARMFLIITGRASTSAVQEFFKRLDQDTINVGMGMTPVQGAQPL